MSACHFELAKAFYLVMTTRNLIAGFPIATGMLLLAIALLNVRSSRALPAMYGMHVGPTVIHCSQGSVHGLTADSIHDACVAEHGLLYKMQPATTTANAFAFNSSSSEMEGGHIIQSPIGTLPCYFALDPMPYCLPACLLACLPACLLACLPAYCQLRCRIAI